MEGMNVLILGGMSKRHQEWIRDVAEVLRPHCEEVRLLDYEHWHNSGREMDIEREITRAAQLVTGLTDYILVAKSIGTAIATLATARRLIAPRRCIFLGFPLKVVRELPEMDMALRQLPPTTFLHNENDPLGSAKEVTSYLQSNSPVQYDIQTLPGGTHDYLDFKLLVRLAQNES